MAYSGVDAESHVRGRKGRKSGRGEVTEKYRAYSDSSQFEVGAGFSRHGASPESSIMVARQLATVRENDGGFPLVTQENLSTIPSAYRQDFDPTRISTFHETDSEVEGGGGIGRRMSDWNVDNDRIVLQDPTTGQYFYDTARPSHHSHHIDNNASHHHHRQNYSESSTSHSSHSSIYAVPTRSSSESSHRPTSNVYASHHQYYYSASTSSRLPPARLHFLPTPTNGPTVQQLSDGLRPTKLSHPHRFDQGHHLSPATNYHPPPPPGLLRSISSPFPHSHSDPPLPAIPIFPIPLLQPKLCRSVTQSFAPNFQPSPSNLSDSSPSRSGSPGLDNTSRATSSPRLTTGGSALGLSFGENSTVGQLLGAVTSSVVLPTSVVKLSTSSMDPDVSTLFLISELW